MINGVIFSYGTKSQKVQNRFLYVQYHSGIQIVFRGSEYMEGIGMMVGKGLESRWIIVTVRQRACAVVKWFYLQLPIVPLVRKIFALASTIPLIIRTIPTIWMIKIGSPSTRNERQTTITNSKVEKMDT